MTDQDAGHSRFDELSAGYALDALEPADERRFLAHAAQCPRCRELIDDFAQVAQALAETSPPAEPSSRLGDRIVAAMLADASPHDGPVGSGQGGGTGAAPAAGDAPRAGPPSLAAPPRGRRARGWRRPAAVAAAAALVAGGGIWAGVAATARGGQPPLAACARPHACPQVELTATRTGRTAATVIVRDGVAWMEPVAMAANPAGDIYVLWQITGSHTPLAVGSFDVRPGARGPVMIGHLAVPYPGTWGFAVSLEHGRALPARPSKPVAVGQVT